jgi:hypothetical protein
MVKRLPGRLRSRKDMKVMIPFRYQLLGHLFITTCLVVLLHLAPPNRESIPDDKTRPYITHADMLVVTVLAHHNGPPEIMSVQPLAEGRISVTQPGDYALILQDNNTEPLYTLSFQVAFTIPGLHQDLEENQLIFVLPGHEQASSLLVSGPYGSSVYDLSNGFIGPLKGDEQ